MDQAVEQQLIEATKIVEAQVDAELDRLDNLDEGELEAIQQKRLASMKKMHDQKQEWLKIGHGQYQEITGEKDFFGECKKSQNVVCHFYRESTFRCKIVDKHMAILAPKHVETRFLKINAEKAPFLAERLKIKVLPTIALIKEGKTKDFIVGFNDLGGTDDFATEMLEWRIACADVINYAGNLTEPPLPDNKPEPSLFKQRKTIRGGIRDDDSDDDDD